MKRLTFYAYLFSLKLLALTADSLGICEDQITQDLRDLRAGVL
jgi:hypothetical protein